MKRRATTKLSLLIIGSSLVLPAGLSASAATEILTVDNSKLTLHLAENLPVSGDVIKDWVQRAATAVSEFYGKYPVPAVAIYIDPADSGGEVQGGVETNGERIVIKLGKETTPASLKNEWMLTHEMFHLSQPDVIGEYSWMSEGMADYLEPVARVRIGQIDAEQFWKDLVEGMPQGLPEAGDQGLDRTHTWGRTYWGGSLFWLLADIRVRQQTHNAKSVRDAASAVLNAGGDGSKDWEIKQLLKAYDAGTGTKVFETLHDEMGEKSVTTDLDALWKSLGVIYSEKQQTVTFDDHAPLAEIRRAITSK